MKIFTNTYFNTFQITLTKFSRNTSSLLYFTLLSVIISSWHSSKAQKTIPANREKIGKEGKKDMYREMLKSIQESA